MEIQIFQVDAFSNKLFCGNPAAVCPLEEWLPDETLQAIAAENNLAETAFFVPQSNRYHLRWFTPTCEVDLCGHATLATAFVLFHFLNITGEKLSFDTQSGELTVSRSGELLILDFPARPPKVIEAPAGLMDAIGGTPIEVLAANDIVILVYGSEAEVLAAAPDMAALIRVNYYAFIVTAPGTTCDYVLRFFAPAQGIPEDPVTGSAHTSLIPYWSKRLNKTEMVARQLSKRTGELYCKSAGDRVTIGGHATAYLRGTITVPANALATMSGEKLSAHVT